MKISFWPAALIAAVAVSIGFAPQAAQQRILADRLVLGEDLVSKVEIETMESAPPQFALVLALTMRTTGWKLKPDSVDSSSTEGRIKVTVTGSPPTGPSEDVPTDERVRIPLGRLQAGDCLLEVWFRSGADEYRRKGAILLTATAG